MLFSRLAHQWTAGKRALVDRVGTRLPKSANVTRLGRPPKVAIRSLVLFAFSMGLYGAVADGADKSDRRLIGPLIDRTLAESTDPAHARLFSELRAKSVNAGAVRVIVGVRVPFAPEGRLSVAQVAAQRDEVRAAQSRIHALLPRHPASAVDHFEYIPFSVLEVDENELAILASSPDVTDIQEDIPLPTVLAQSAPLVRATDAWAAGYNGSGWSVAILDTGVDKTHAFFTGRVVSEACYSTTSAASAATSVCPGGAASSTATGSGVNCSTSIPGCDHGTHVAGIAAGFGASFSGIARGASILAMQVFSRVDSATTCGGSAPCALSYGSDRVKALQRVYALRTTYNIASVNMSIGGQRYYTQAACDAASSSEKSAIDLLRSVGIATVIASGNDGYVDSTGAPGCISSAVVVGATFDAAGYSNVGDGWNGGTSSVDEVAYFSNSAAFLDMLAPGADINSSVPGGSYAGKWGTSMATPHVTGCWAVLKQGSPSSTVDQIEQALKDTGVPVTDWRTGGIKPRIDCKAALDHLRSGIGGAPNLQISAFAASPLTVVTGSNLTLSGTVRNSGTAASSATTLRYYVWSGSVWNHITACADPIGALSPGATSSQSCTFAAPGTIGTYFYTVSVDSVASESSTSDNAAPASATVSVTGSVATNYLLTVSKAGTGSGTVNGTGIDCGLDCSQSFPSGTVVSLSATAAPGSSFTGWSGACAGGSCQVTMTAARSVTANFAANPPNLTISSFVVTPTTAGVGESITMSATVRNAGTGSSASSYLRYYYWTGYDWAEITSCMDSVAGLAPGASTAQACVVWWNVAGTNYVYVAVDSVAGESAAWDNSTEYVTVTIIDGTTICNIQPIAYGQTFYGSQTTTDCVRSGGYRADVFSFAGTAGDAIAISQNSGAIDPYLELFAPDGSSIAYNDDASGTLNSRIPDTGFFVLPVSGTYLIEASSYSGTDVGQYSLTVVASQNPAAAGSAWWDVLWRNGSGIDATWTFTGPGATQFVTGFAPTVPTTWQAKGTGDIDGNGVPDVVWFQPSSGLVAVWRMNSPTGVAAVSYPAAVGAGSPWAISATGDLNGDGRADLVWRHGTSGEVLIWYMSAIGTISSTKSLGTVSLTYQIRGVGDFNGDGRDDILWIHPSDGVVVIYLMSADGTFSGAFPGAVGPGNWRPYRIGDFDGDGKADIFWRNEANGMTAAWYMNGGTIAASDFFVSVPMATWQLGSVGDFDLDGRSDLMWYAPASGGVSRWMMQGRHVAPVTEVLPGVGTGWQIIQ